MGKRKKHYISAHVNKRKKSDGVYGKLEIGMQGVLITHDRGKENLCRNDAFKILNYFADKWYGTVKGEKTLSEKPGATVVSIDEDVGGSDEEDIDAALSKEVDCIKDTAHVRKRFYAVKSGCNNVVFIKTFDLKPSNFVRRVIQTIAAETTDDHYDADIPAARGVLRIHPVDYSCRATMSEINSMAKRALPQLLGDVEQRNIGKESFLKEYNVMFRGRNNNEFGMHIVTDAIVEVVKDVAENWRYNCRSTDIYVIVEIIINLVRASVVENYARYKKFNVRELFVERAMKKCGNAKDGDGRKEQQQEKQEQYETVKEEKKQNEQHQEQEQEKQPENQHEQQYEKEEEQKAQKLEEK
ncbi:LOW QUALITY PROTEIN: THUMP domain-containing protein 1-like [Ciona intestinalis]